MKKFLSNVIFASRWVLYPINLGLLTILIFYIAAFLHNDYLLIKGGNFHDLEHLMVLMLGFVDASMVANLIVMIIQGSHQIFITGFNKHPEELPQYLKHIDTGILKVKVALSISSITLVQLLKDFVNLDKVEWTIVQHRMAIHGLVLISALIVAIIWRVTHPKEH